MEVKRAHAVEENGINPAQSRTGIGMEAKRTNATEWIRRCSSGNGMQPLPWNGIGELKCLAECDRSGSETNNAVKWNGIHSINSITAGWEWNKSRGQWPPGNGMNGGDEFD